MTASRKSVAILVLGSILACGPGGATPEEAASPSAALAPAESLLDLAESRYWNGEIVDARADFEAALEAARRSADSAAEARALTWLGLCAYRLGDHALARRLGEDALALKLRLDLRDDLFRSYNALGLLAFAEGRYFDAVELHRQGLEWAEVRADTVALTKARTNLGLAHTELGDFPEARRLFLQAFSGARYLEDPLIEGRVLTNLGMLAVRTGEPARAIRFLRVARRALREAEDVVGEQNALGQMGTAYAAIGEPGRAIAVLDSALAMAREQGLRQEESSNLEQLAELYRQAGDHARALRLFRVARGINAELDLQDETGADLRSEAEIHADLGNLDLARRAAREALAIHRRVGSRLSELTDLILLADLSLRAGDRPEAEGFLREAHQTAGRLDAPTARAAVALAEARLADASQEDDRVLAALRRAGRDLVEAGPEVQWEADLLTARARFRSGAPDSAAAAGFRAVAALERVRGGFASAALRTSYASGRSEAYRDLVDYLLALGRVEEAFEVADRSRGRVLLEHLATLRENGGATVRELAEEERQLLARIDELVVLSGDVPQAETLPDGERERLREELERTRAEYTAALVRAEERQADAMALLGGGHPDTGAIRAALEPEEALLGYLVGPESVRLFVVTREGVRSFDTLVERSRLAARIRIVRELLGRPSADPETGRAALEALHAILLGEAVRAGALEGRRRLIVVPDGEIGYVPFAALRGRDGRFLVERVSLVHLPSAASLPVLRGGRAARAEDAGGTALAPFPDDLPASRGEAEALRLAAPKAMTVVGDEATEEALREALARDGIVHAATHGILNARNPMFSRLEMARGERGDPADDGRLEVHELIGLPIRASLVFLSGCETGAGVAGSTSYSSGEDYATLARAFLYGGARNVIATLWRVRDRGAAAFADAFYRELAVTPRASADVAEALARAQRRLIGSEEHRAPYHWAGYRASGAGRIAAPARRAAFPTGSLAGDVAQDPDPLSVLGGWNPIVHTLEEPR